MGFVSPTHPKAKYFNACVWRYGFELQPVDSDEVNLFARGIMPGDVEQGKLNDCWLLAAMSAVAEHPHLIKACFETDRLSTIGKYTCLLYDAAEGKRVPVVVSSKFPCFSEAVRPDDVPAGTPLFAQPKNNELWALVLEKAFAKWCLGYMNIEAGFPLWAMQLITGGMVYRLDKVQAGAELSGEMVTKGGGRWVKKTIENAPTDSNPRAVNWFEDRSQPGWDVDGLWLDLKGLHDRSTTSQPVILTTATRATGKVRPDGLVDNHTYAILELAEADGVQLVKLRNPWRKYEWHGDWADDSPLWEERPSVTRAIWPARAEQGHTLKNEGIFWMPFLSLLEVFDCVDVCIGAVLDA